MKGQKMPKLRQKGLEINGKINGNPGFISQIIFWISGCKNAKMSLNLQEAIVGVQPR
jgi:hypothetical protein